MKIQTLGDTLRIATGTELGAANASQFREEVRELFLEDLKNIEIDLSATTFLDSCGLGVLIELRKLASSRAGKLQLLNPQPPVQQILELTRMNQLFDIVKS